MFLTLSPVTTHTRAMKAWQKYKTPVLLCFLVVILFLMGMSSESGTYHWQWRRAMQFIVRYRSDQWVMGPLVHGLVQTLYIVGVSFFLAIGLGLSTACLRQAPSLVGQGIAKAYVGLVRNTPLLIQLFVVYFILAPMGNLSPFWAAAWTLAAFEGAYMAEIFRAGINSVPKEQWDAASSMGFSSVQIFLYVVLPQAFRRVLPPLTGQTVSLIKDSALVSAIAIPDLTMQAQLIIADTFLSLEIWILVAALYVILSLLVTIPVKLVERRYAWQWL